MLDLSLHLLDIIENSVRAAANNVWVTIGVNEKEDTLKMIIADDGQGMDQATLQKAKDPFYTSKAERIKKVGLGIPLFAQNATLAGGSFSIESEEGVGTVIEAVFGYRHIDRMPLGNFADTMLGVIISHPEVDFHLVLEHATLDGETYNYDFSTATLKETLDGVPFTYPAVISYINEQLNEAINITKLEEH